MRTARDGGYTVRPVPQRQKNREPTAGVEPATPALRERCSGHLSYVGIGTVRIVSPKELSFRGHARSWRPAGTRQVPRHSAACRPTRASARVRRRRSLSLTRGTSRAIASANARHECSVMDASVSVRPPRLLRWTTTDGAHRPKHLKRRLRARIRCRLTSWASLTAPTSSRGRRWSCSGGCALSVRFTGQAASLSFPTKPASGR